MDTYCELTGFNKRRFRAVPAPRSPESQITDEGLSVTGEFGKNASRILMPLLWLSRLTWLDLSFIVPRLASRVTSRTKFEDKQLHRYVAHPEHRILKTIHKTSALINCNRGSVD